LELAEGSIARKELTFTFADPRVPVVSEPIGVPNGPNGPLETNDPADKLIELMSIELRLSDKSDLANRLIGTMFPVGAPEENVTTIPAYVGHITSVCKTRLNNNTDFLIVHFLSIKKRDVAKQR